MFLLFRSIRFIFVFVFRSNIGAGAGSPLPLLSRIVPNPFSSHVTEDAPELALERRKSVDVANIGRRGAAEEAFERRGGGFVVRLLSAESRESLLSLSLFPLIEEAAGVAALIGAPKLGPTVFEPQTNTEPLYSHSSQSGDAW